MKRKILCLLCAAVLCVSVICAAAEDMLGSISITMHYQGIPVPGGTLTLYQVALQDGERWVLTEDFYACGLNMYDVSAASAKEFAAYAAEQGIAGRKEIIDESGFVAFWELEAGLYLLVQEDAAEGYSLASPFFVTVPCDGAYDVDASPKLSLTTDETEPPPSTEPTKPTDPGLPKTGQMNWPVPVLAAGGLLVFMVGMFLNRTGRKERYES